jgi:Na+/melibiose symporter-like transporter
MAEIAPGVRSSNESPVKTPRRVAAFLTSLFSRFLVLRGALPELWVIFAVKVIGIIAYSLMNSTLVLWLSYDLGYSDELAARVVFIWSAVLTLFTVFAGSLTDALGIRRTFLLGISICVVARILVTFAPISSLLLAVAMICSCWRLR